MIDQLKMRNLVSMRRRPLGAEEWGPWQPLAENILTTAGKGFFLDAAAGSPTTIGSIVRFEVGAGGRETTDINNSGTLTAGSVLSFGNNARNQLAQVFMPATGATSRFIVRPAANTGTPTDDLIIQLFITSGADQSPGTVQVPTGAALATQHLRNRDWVAWIGSELPLNIRYTTMVIGSHYAVVIRRSGTTLSDAAAYNVCTFNSGTDSYTSGNLAFYSGTAWQNGFTTLDLYFKEFYPTFDGAPIAKTVNTNTLTIPVTNKAITSHSRTGDTSTYLLDLSSLDANTPGKISEARMMVSQTGSALAAVAFRDEDKTEDIETQLSWQFQFV